MFYFHSHSLHFFQFSVMTLTVFSLIKIYILDSASIFIFTHIYVETMPLFWATLFYWNESHTYFLYSTNIYTNKNIVSLMDYMDSVLSILCRLIFNQFWSQKCQRVSTAMGAHIVSPVEWNNWIIAIPELLSGDRP